MPRRPAPMWYVLVTVMVSMLLVSGAGIWYTNHVDAKREHAERESDRNWCSIVGTMNQAFNDPANPPQTEIGRQLAADFAKLYAELDC